MVSASSKKLFNWFWVLLLFLFAYLQLNDPDPLKWSLLYSLLAIIIALHAIGKDMQTSFLVYSMLMFLLGLICLPDMMAWIQAGMPSLTQEMKASDPTIESMRELGGVIICLLLSVYYWLKTKKTTRK